MLKKTQPRSNTARKQAGKELHNSSFDRLTQQTRSLFSLLLPLAIGGGVLLATLALWQMTQIQERKQLERKVQLAAEAARNETQAGLNTRIIAFQYLMTPWKQVRETTPVEWQKTVDKYRQFYPSLKTVQWVDASLNVRRTVTLLGESAPTLQQHLKVLEANPLTEKKEIVALPRRSVNGNPHLGLYIRMVNENRFDGFLFASFQMDILFQKILTWQILPDYEIRLVDGSREIFRRSATSPSSPLGPTQSIPLSVHNLTLQLQIRPSLKLLEEERSLIPQLVLIAGILVAGSLSWAVYGTQRARIKAKQLETLNQVLNQEICDRKAVEIALRQHAQMIDLAGDAIAIWSLEGVITYWNSGAESLYAWTKQEVVGQSIHTLLNTQFPQPLSDILAHCQQQGSWEGELVQTQRDGKQITVASRWTLQRNEQGDFAAILEINTDITEQNQAREELRQSEARLRQKAIELENALQELRHTQSKLIQSEKMSSLGQLVAGIAHEINNPVNFIFGNLTHAKEYTENIMALLQLYQQEYPHPTPTITEEAEAIDLEFLITDLPKLLDSMKVGADRIRDIVLSLRSFSRIDEAEMKEVDIHEGIDSTLMILQNRLKAKADSPGIKAIQEYGALPLIECYAGQLNQVFMNLLANAIDALEQSVANRQSHPTIWIRTEVKGDFAIVRISDNGPGMSEDVKSRLFDPFFTTKPIGKGTGLGLAISYSIIVEKHRGKLGCHSTLGEGTTFIIEIPVRQNF